MLVTWIAWLNVFAFPIVLGLVVATATAWVLRRSIGAQLSEIERTVGQLLARLDEQPEPMESDLLEADRHARYRRRPVSTMEERG